MPLLLIPSPIPQLHLSSMLIPVSRGKHLVAARDLHALLKAVGNGSLAAGGGLGESSRATEGAGTGTVTDTDDADVVSSANGGVAGLARGHLDSERELGVGGQRQTLDTKARNVLGDVGLLEGSVVSATGGTVNLSSQWTSAILVDLRAS